MNHSLIKKIRKRLDLTQTEFAKLFVVSYQTISRWESNLNSPTIANAKKLIEFAKKARIVITINDIYLK